MRFTYLLTKQNCTNAVATNWSKKM